MKIPSFCPFCKSVLITYYPQEDNLIFYRRCQQQDHNISFYAEINSELVYKTSTTTTLNNKPSNIYWIHTTKDCLIVQSTHVIIMPYFEPQFYSYKTLLNKIKTYLVFS